MNSKRLKLDETLCHSPVEISTKKFLDINDDCILAIFERLSLKELGGMTDVCKRFKELAENVFRRKYPENVSEKFYRIYRNTYGDIGLYPPEYGLLSIHNYVKFFWQCMENMDIADAYNRGDIRCLIDYIQSHWSKNLKKIRFRYSYIHGELGDSIKNVLEHIEAVEFIFCFNGTKFYDTILRHCHNVKSLVLQDHGGNQIDDVLGSKYPKLEQFELDYDGHLNSDLLKTFLLLNPNIKSLVWYIYDRGVNLSESIKCIVDHAFNFEKMDFVLKKTSRSKNPCEGVIHMCGHKLFKKLSLEVCSGERPLELIKLASLSLEELDYGKTPFRILIPEIKSLPNLRVLKAYITSLDDEFNYQINLTEKDFPKLEELELSFYGPIPEDQIREFVRNVVNLKKITIGTVYYPERRNKLNFSIAKMNFERQRLPDACELTIHLGKGCRKTEFGTSRLVKIVFD